MIDTRSYKFEYRIINTDDGRYLSQRKKVISTPEKDSRPYDWEPLRTDWGDDIKPRKFLFLCKLDISTDKADVLRERKHFFKREKEKSEYEMKILYETTLNL